MRVQVISDSNHGLGLSSRFSQSGHTVQAANTFSPATNPDLVINLTQHRYDVGEKCKYLGPTLWSGALDSDQEYAQKIINMIGWKSGPITPGINIYFTSWFNGDATILSYATILYRRLMAGGCGPDIGCAGSIALFDCLTDRTHETFLKPLERILKRVSHQGVFHIHAVANSSTFYVKGVSTRIYHPLTLVALENTNLAVANVFLKTLDVTSRSLRPLDPVASSVFLSAPPYPYQLTQQLPALEVRGINPGSLKHLWLEDVYTNNGQYLLGSSGAIGHVTARGATPQEAFRRIYKTVSNISVPDIQYRNDVGRNINTLIESLRAQGWIT